MFRIGEFSRIARVSARQLRFYEEIGLFEPVEVDARSGYRSYALVQLADLNRILVLKDLGFSLDQIGDILKSKIGPDELRRMLLLRRNDVERQLELESLRLRQIEARIAQLETDGAFSADDVVVRPEPAQTLLSLRCTVSSFDAARGLIGELIGLARPLLKRAPPPVLVAVAHTEQFETDILDIEFGIRLNPGERIRVEGLAMRELPAVDQMAICVRAGLPEHAHLVTAKVGAYLAASGRRLDGPGREVFLRFPDLDRMHEAVVEMQFPVRAAMEIKDV